MCFLPLIFPRRSEAGGGTVSYRKAAGGCQGVVGPDPSTLLNELNSTSFCHGEVSNSVTPSEFPFLLSSSFHHVFFRSNVGRSNVYFVYLILLTFDLVDLRLFARLGVAS
jgi:hypothetical protein